VRSICDEGWKGSSIAGATLRTKMTPLHSLDLGYAGRSNGCQAYKKEQAPPFRRGLSSLLLRSGSGVLDHLLAQFGVMLLLT
jgi:hypothetical protein